MPEFVSLVSLGLRQRPSLSIMASGATCLANRVMLEDLFLLWMSSEYELLGLLEVGAVDSSVARDASVDGLILSQI